MRLKRSSRRFLAFLVQRMGPGEVLPLRWYSRVLRTIPLDGVDVPVRPALESLIAHGVIRKSRQGISWADYDRAVRYLRFEGND